MSQHLRAFAIRVENDHFFLACYLHLYAESEDMTDEKLAASLGCSEETLVQVKLCRAPAGESKAYQADIDRIATRFGIKADVLVEMARRGEVLLKIRGMDHSKTTNYLAARDQEAESRSKP